MKTANFNTFNTLNNAAMTTSLLACATLSIAILFSGNNGNTSPTINQTMEPIVVTAQRIPTIQLATMEITAKRLTPAMPTVALAPMIIVAKRTVV